MALHGGSKLLFLANGRNLTAMKMDSVQASVESKFANTEGVGGIRSDGNSIIWDETTPTGEKTATLAQSGGIYDTRTGASHEFFRDIVNASTLATAQAFPAVILPLGNVAGREMFSTEGLNVGKYSVQSSSEDVHRANPEYTISGGIDFQGMILLPWDSYTTAAAAPATETNFTAPVFQHGDMALPSVRRTVLLQTAGIPADHALIVRIEHSSDGLTYTTYGQPIIRGGPTLIGDIGTRVLEPYIRVTVISLDTSSNPSGDPAALTDFQLFVGIRPA